MVQQVARRHHLRGPFVRVEGRGTTNHVYLGEQEVVRFPRDPLRGVVTDVGEFATEAWCQQAAARVGVPTPEVVEVGEVEVGPWGGADARVVPYGVQRRVAGRPLEPGELSHWAPRLAEHAAAIATIDLTAAPSGLFTRFGRDLPDAWSQHLTYNLDALRAPDDPLRLLGVHDSEDVGWMRAELEPLAGPRPTGLPGHGVCHGDLNPENLLVVGDGPGRDLVLLDWGSATAGPVPWTDLYHLHPGVAEVLTPAFAAQWGLEVDELARTLARVRLLSALDLVRWSLDRRPDLLDGYVAAARTAVTSARRGAAGSAPR